MVQISSVLVTVIAALSAVIPSIAYPSYHYPAHNVEKGLALEARRVEDSLVRRYGMDITPQFRRQLVASIYARAGNKIFQRHDDQTKMPGSETFVANDWAARTGKSRKTVEAVKIPAKSVPEFKLSRKRGFRREPMNIFSLIAKLSAFKAKKSKTGKLTNTPKPVLRVKPSKGRK